MIRCLGVIGKSDEPLYLRDFVETNSLSEEKESTIEDEDKPFVFFSEMNKRCTLNHQLIMHSALDTFEEAILQQKNKLGRNKSWYGKLCRIDNMRVFGTCTARINKTLNQCVNSFSNVATILISNFWSLALDAYKYKKMEKIVTLT